MAKSKPQLQSLDGLLMSKKFFTSDNFRETVNYRPQPGDIFVVTYPKCGTTWMQYIVWGILNDGADPPFIHEMNEDITPFLELKGTSGLLNIPFPRALKTHMPFELTPWGPDAKYIYVARNPWDVCVSYFHFHNEVPQSFEFFGDFEDFAHCFIEGELAWGSYFDHVLSFYKEKDRHNVLFLTYEELKKDLTKSVQKVASFLGEAYSKKLESEKGLLQRIVHNTSFEYMKKLPYLLAASEEVVVKTLAKTGKSHPGKDIDPSSKDFIACDFFKKGTSGYGKSFEGFTDTLRAKMEQIVRHKFGSFPELLDRLEMIHQN